MVGDLSGSGAGGFSECLWGECRSRGDWELGIGIVGWGVVSFVFMNGFSVVRIMAYPAGQIR